MIRTLWIACLVALMTACASQPQPQPKPSSLPDPNGLPPPELSQPDPAPAPSPPPVPSQSEPATTPTQSNSAATPASSTPGAPPSSDATAAILEAAEPTENPSAELAPDKSAAGMEQLGEISSSTAGAPATRPCNFDNCGVIISIGPRSTQDLSEEQLQMDPGSGPGVYVGGGIDSGGFTPEQPVSGAYLSSSGSTLWEIVVQMHDGSKHPIFQEYKPLLQVGDAVVVDGNNIELWNP